MSVVSTGTTAAVPRLPARVRAVQGPLSIDGYAVSCLSPRLLLQSDCAIKASVGLFLFRCSMLVPFHAVSLDAVLYCWQEASQAASARQLQNAALMRPPPTQSQPLQLPSQSGPQQRQQQAGAVSRPLPVGMMYCHCS